tara:strand:- start:294 stop:482 length:189 start_codon:yes stop_codon:yes gene_type:complete
VAELRVELVVQVAVELGELIIELVEQVTHLQLVHLKEIMVERVQLHHHNQITLVVEAVVLLQ